MNDESIPHQWPLDKYHHIQSDKLAKTTLYIFFKGKFFQILIDIAIINRIVKCKFFVKSANFLSVKKSRKSKKEFIFIIAVVLSFSIQNIFVSKNASANESFVSGLLKEADTHREPSYQNDIIYKELFSKLNNSDAIKILLVPLTEAFRIKIDKSNIEDVSCIYQIDSSSPQFSGFRKEIIGMISDYSKYSNIIEDNIDIKTGIIFASNFNTIGSAFFDYIPNKNYLNGLLSGRPIKIRANVRDHITTIIEKHESAIRSYGKHYCN